MNHLARHRAPSASIAHRRLLIAATGLVGAFGVPCEWATAQTVHVHTIEADTRRVVSGAIVVLIDRAGARVSQGLTNDFGRLDLRAPGRGVYYLRADRIGHPGMLSPPIALEDSASVELLMPLEAVTLPDLAVLGATPCRPRADGPATASLWQEIRKALAASRLTSTQGLVPLAVRRFRRRRDLAGRALSDSTLTEFSTSAAPFVSPSPATLRDEGYVRENDGQFSFSSPDLATLLSDSFLATHCFSVAGPANGSRSEVGLGFKPADRVGHAEIQGVLWVNRSSAELRSLEFTFVDVPEAVRAPGLGGQLEFRRLTNGAWIVSDWYLRTPDRVAIRHQNRWPVQPTLQDSVVGYVDEGGVARPMGDARVALGEAVASVDTTTRLLGEVRGHVRSPEGAPIAGAEVALAASDSEAVTGGDGAFRLGGLPAGRHRLRIRAVGFRPLDVGFLLSDAVRSLDTTLTLHRPLQTLDSLVVNAQPTTFMAGKMEEVEQRRKLGFGRFLTRAELHDPLRGDLAMQLRRFARITLVALPWECGGGLAAAAWDRGSAPTKVICGPFVLPYCFLMVYLDGALYWSPSMGTMRPPPDLDRFNMLDLEAVELYRSPSELPIEYTGPEAACGVLLLWTRVG
jgi:Carboxypeptidase regulatory-like domain